ncbi:hypothetical protein SLEP1_g56102 [Rubroshorea leprosula]|uniref:Uncharacterized protein n=1 Tax=Rubroshorea leprosula TaxID=152421 RepID=A0AAV5MKN5_9ROSI|nr:hypothetical protein SLEP1_g56102 [Rubroshorea leprosula]
MSARRLSHLGFEFWGVTIIHAITSYFSSEIAAFVAK